VRRYDAARIVVRTVARAILRPVLEGELPEAPYVLCFSHQNWLDPVLLLGCLPGRPRLYFFGPQEEEMRRGFRNRLMRWTGLAVPYRPGKRGLLAALGRAEFALRRGSVLVIAGEGRIHAGERAVLPIQGGAPYLAMRTGAPLVPLAVNGTSWLGFRRRVRLSIGRPIERRPALAGRPTAQETAELAAEITIALRRLVADFPEQPRPGVLGRWLTELFNDWPEGARPSAASPADTAGPSGAAPGASAAVARPVAAGHARSSPSPVRPSRAGDRRSRLR